MSNFIHHLKVVLHNALVYFTDRYYNRRYTFYTFRYLSNVRVNYYILLQRPHVHHGVVYAPLRYFSDNTSICAEYVQPYLRKVIIQRCKKIQDTSNHS